MLEVRFLTTAKDVFDELSPADQEAIVEALHLVQSFPKMYPLRRGRFSGYRHFVARRRWRVVYRVSDDVIYVRVIWPARARPL